MPHNSFKYLNYSDLKNSNDFKVEYNAPNEMAAYFKLREKW